MRNFSDRHIGSTDLEMKEMLEITKNSSIEELMSQVIPSKIMGAGIDEIESHTEVETLDLLNELANKNKCFRNFIGKGYYGTVMPPVIQRNIFENPAWYTAYTPYQAEISQGRLEALMNFQTMISELTGLDISNASLLDEGTALAEAVTMSYRAERNAPKKILIDKYIFDQSKDVLKTRVQFQGIEVSEIDDLNDLDKEKDSSFALAIQYPNSEGNVLDIEKVIKKYKSNNPNANVILICDVMALLLIKSPKSVGADIVVGNTQRFGVPMGFGGPHAAYIASVDSFKRLMPGRIVGVSKDREGNVAYRMSLQTREQHIKRDRATSNICTSQVLLSILASMYAVYHGKEGLKFMANTIHRKALQLANLLIDKGYTLKHSSFFDTIVVQSEFSPKIYSQLLQKEINVYQKNDKISISIDENTSTKDIENIIESFPNLNQKSNQSKFEIPIELLRNDDFLNQKIFNTYLDETSMMRYIKRLESKDFSLVHGMIPLGSCTMKLNAASLMLSLSNKLWNSIHPMAPEGQAEGYKILFKELENHFKIITKFAGISLQPNAGSQGEFAGLSIIKNYLSKKGEVDRNICLIPSSAHGTNPASATLAGMKIEIIKTNQKGEIDLEDLEKKIKLYTGKIATLMITYPSTYGVFDENINSVVDIIHNEGALIYLDGANMNAQVAYTSPFEIGADVCHLNLHKTFAIPHGGGGPGVGAIGVVEKLVPFLPSKSWEDRNIAISSCPWGSSLILLISYAFIHQLGSEGLKKSTQYAILNANYLKSSLEKSFKIHYSNINNRVAHEFIIDCSVFTNKGVDAVMIAKRLMDYNFHAPTVSFPLPNSLMIEPTESESKETLDMFIATFFAIYQEINEINEETMKNNPICNAPHTATILAKENWDYPYSREKAVYPLKHLKKFKFWPSVSKIDEAFGDRNLMCSCDPIESYINN